MADTDVCELGGLCLFVTTASCAHVHSSIIYKSFFSVQAEKEFWEYLNGVLMPQLFNPVPGLGRGFVLGQNILVGTLRLRQVRVRAGTCRIESEFKTVFPECYARYSGSRIEKESFTVKGRRYFSAKELKTQTQLAGLQLYEGGGFIEDFSLSDDLDVHLAHLAELRADGWLDLQTRVVWVDFTTYNANLNLAHVAQMSFEFMPSGGIFPAYTYRVMRIYKYPDTALGRAQLAGEIILLFFIAYYLLQEVYEMWLLGCIMYWQSGWNVIDLLNVLLFICVFGVRIAFVTAVRNLKIDPTETRSFFNFQPASLLNSTEQNILACNAFILWFKIFKYTRFLPGMDVISETVARSLRNTVSFVAMMAFVLFGFAQAGVLAFGTDVPGYHTFIDTFFTLLRTLLGDFDFESMQRSNRVFGPLYFLSFIVLVFFILLSMFMAILNDAYTDVQDSLREEQKGKVNLLHVFGDWMKDKEGGLDEFVEGADNLQDALMGDAADDDILDREEIEMIFQKYKKEAKQLLGVNSADELLREFDTDGDNLLSRAEQENLFKNLSERKVQAQVQKHQLSLAGTAAPAPKIFDAAELDSEFAAYLTSVKRDLLAFHERMSRMDAQMQLVVDKLGEGRSGSSSGSSS